MSHTSYYPERDPSTVLKVNKRYLGEFKCDNCATRWESKYARLGRSKSCQECGEWVYPRKLSYLKPPDVFAGYYGENLDWGWTISTDIPYNKENEDQLNRTLEYLFPPLSSTQKSSSSSGFGGLWKITFVAVLGYMAYRYLKR